MGQVRLPRDRYSYPAGEPPYLGGPWDPRLPRDFFYQHDTGHGRFGARYDKDRFQDLTLPRDRSPFIAVPPSVLPCPALQTAAPAQQAPLQPVVNSTPAAATANC